MFFESYQVATLITALHVFPLRLLAISQNHQQLLRPHRQCDHRVVNASKVPVMLWRMIQESSQNINYTPVQLAEKAEKALGSSCLVFLPPNCNFCLFLTAGRWLHWCHPSTAGICPCLPAHLDHLMGLPDHTAALLLNGQNFPVLLF